VTGTASEFLRVVDLTGVFGNAVLGGILAREHRMDPVGFIWLAILSGLGGGLIRDTLLQHGPPIALTDYLYVMTAVAGAVVAFLAPVHDRIWRLTFPAVDALALGCWAAAGAQKTLQVGLGWLPAVLLGTITAVGGGALRDLTVLRIPQIFGGNTLYATCAMAASLVMVLFNYLGHAPSGMLVATGVGAGMCLLARWRGWQLWQGLGWEYAVQRPPGKRWPRIRVQVNRMAAPSPDRSEEN
jgi:uncharacterized membrane protein YeiH